MRRGSPRERSDGLATVVAVKCQLFRRLRRDEIFPSYAIRQTARSARSAGHKEGTQVAAFLRADLAHRSWLHARGTLRRETIVSSASMQRAVSTCLPSRNGNGESGGEAFRLNIYRKTGFVRAHSTPRTLGVPATTPRHLVLEQRWSPDHCCRRTTDRLNPARVPRETIALRGDVCTHLPRIYDAFCAQHSGSQDGASLARRASSDQSSGACCAGSVDPNGPARRLADWFIYRLRLGWQREYPRSAD